MATTAYISTLTPLRGIAAILVVILHFDLIVMPTFNRAWSPAHEQLYLMVDFFFVLSGFVLSHVYGDWFAEGPKRLPYRQYMVARFARIYPLHLFTLTWVIGVYALFVWFRLPLEGPPSEVLDPKSIPLHLILAQAFYPVQFGTWNTPSWSISTEWLMYLLFPFLIRPFLRMGRSGRALMLLLALGAYGYVMHFTASVPPENTFFHPEHSSLNTLLPPWVFARCAAGFSIGMVAYQAYCSKWLRGPLKSGWALALAGMLLLALFHFKAPDIVCVCLFPLIILAAAYNTGYAASLLNKRIFQRLGDWSYSIYLTHMPIIMTLLAISMISNPNNSHRSSSGGTGALLPLLFCLAFTSFIVLVSMLTHRYIEVPMRRWLNRPANK